MRLAVTYEYDGTIFQHFGKTEVFKIYEIEDGKVLYSELVDSNAQGHSALAEVLSENAVSVLICGGIGMGAQIALDDAGIEMVTGISGNADEAVESYLKGELKTGGATCDHHHEHGEGCCHHDHDHEGGCCHHDHDHEDGCCHHHNEEESHCGHGGCCGRHKPAFEGKNVGKTCKVHYLGTFNDGTKFDSSYDRHEPLEFVCGAGMMILGFDKAVANMNVGETIDIHLAPEEAYGPSDPNMILTFKIEQLPGSEELKVGDKVALSNSFGQPFPVVVTAKDDESITLDANHEMAGKELNFKIELVEVE